MTKVIYITQKNNIPKLFSSVILGCGVFVIVILFCFVLLLLLSEVSRLLLSPEQ